MHPLRTEEKAALLLAEADDDEQEHDDEYELTSPALQSQHDNFPVVAKRPKTYQRHRSLTSHPVLCFTLILVTFVLGCASGVAMMLYRMSQDAEQGALSGGSSTTNMFNAPADVNIRTKLFQTISRTSNFVSLDR
jgi:hypothetical protein